MQRWVWLIGLYMASVLLVGSLAWLIRWCMHL